LVLRGGKYLCVTRYIRSPSRNTYSHLSRVSGG
jgi:hypothetical protein